jgi:hypothetical protein
MECNIFNFMPRYAYYAHEDPCRAREDVGLRDDAVISFEKSSSLENSPR